MLSIVIPTYNRCQELKECIRSILNQQYADLEIIIIDDCSGDDTPQFLSGLKENRQIVILSNKTNKGVNYSRNRGIECASQPFILFLDSDDKLTTDSLEKVKLTIESNPSVSHFLFNVSDRLNEFSNGEESRPIYYKDWISGSVSGDFTHIIKTSIIKQYLFFEQFRMYEHLNWLRIKKITSPQLFVRHVVTDRDRNRADSLTNSMKLQNAAVIKAKFESEKLYYSMYYADLLQYNTRSLSSQLIQAIALGTACNQKDESKSLLQYSANSYVRLLSSIVLMIPSALVKYGIIKYSAFKSRRFI